MKRVGQWSAEEVSRWLNEEGMPEYNDALHRADGPALLRLSQADFQTPPLSLVSSDNGRQLLERLETLCVETHMEAHQNGHANGHAGLPNGTGKLQRNGSSSSGQNGYRKDMVHIPIPMGDSEYLVAFPSEWGKTGVAFLYAVFCFVTTTVVISVVHERVPAKEHTPPLPDKFFDLFDRVEWAFSICEINGMLLVGLWLLQWTLLKYRSIIGRRFFFIVGTLYLYRCVTMYITTLPVPGMHFKCSPKLFGDWEAQIRRIMKMIAGGGLSITGSHTMCGDYLYSGHTVMLTLTYLFIKEYSPKRFWWYHWMCWSLSAVGIFCILLAHDHYTVDVVVAYFITTRLFWWYHTLANQQSLKETSQSNPFSRVWWYRLFQYFEENVKGIVPRNYQLPLSWRAPLWSRGVKYSRLDTQ
ncbi:phosphatidylcholine:ceramide cholinephosphotransferase 1 [Hypomesus transpacificus]|uniref:phosphatidylcholine:ceramide cholinephosphotransferase 1 n=1 Tax=Hypomesus transpacificus TaxID=137520 RepID=UPI001F074332|nr:phosphatidylcholine:ceramide cholinephosphotransferase 1 [Hypomesus transpacificus]XP_046885740.1 phosphatidylcholine:ceramide cholinephosphotransferase 1 [Hypomesus transpacificus]XP_046885741.1 phosphatidylcholine:ceramide cholinephosphotransferase 1 [Hypomesus transpacificus]XP_046885742.1 phosphatidylcholine:ceramide cholinephosphotransferase 1 [Hypomesus transpacificus]XP_046885743.1 phosphatidylcholine:ceramide cholinephosphotransferase 1 [Hypomesus transpacificus]